MVLMNKGHVGAALLHGYQTASEVIIGGSIATGQVLLIIPVNIQDGLAAFCLLDSISIAVIDEGGGRITISGELPAILYRALNG